MTISQLEDPSAPLVAVAGATGNQGGSVMHALAESDRAYRIRGFTRDPSKPAAQALIAKGVESADFPERRDSRVQKRYIVRSLDVGVTYRDSTGDSETTTAGVTIQSPQVDINTGAGGGGSRLTSATGSSSRARTAPAPSLGLLATGRFCSAYELQEPSSHSAEKQDFSAGRGHVDRMLSMRFEGTDMALMVLLHTDDGDGQRTLRRRSSAWHQAEFRFLLETKISLSTLSESRIATSRTCSPRYLAAGATFILLPDSFIAVLELLQAHHAQPDLQTART
ncbi:hypothetical protein DFH07DRAFT_964842 [Mycena maculata]|uniref:NmrA-like domain-containing protein n=1 Tax=Mycena maculata TaxID=230809 RepID=A0AAD7IGK2_9AGAR|nr:hypothetical protein DFH07DRAFT_964842 [Mycena maculata]